MTRILAFLLVFAVFSALVGCSPAQPALTKYSYEFLGSFDTLIQFMGYAKDQASFEKMAKKGQARFEELHRIFDIYHDYDGIVNVKTLNDQAGAAPVKAGADLLDFITFCIDWHDRTDGVCNIALGPVLSLWHDARTNGTDDPATAALPDRTALLEASRLCDIRDVRVDKTAGTVFLARKGMSLDVGAVAKGYACRVVMDELKSAGYSSFVISGGGNIVTVGAPQDGIRKKWGVGIQNPDGNPLNPDDSPLDVAYVNDLSVVTSGDYQRTYVVDGKPYHHLIDPATLMPAVHYRSVTVMTPDPGLADFFSTTLFLLPYGESLAAAKKDGIDALWIFPDGTVETTDGMKAVLRDLGGATNR